MGKLKKYKLKTHKSTAKRFRITGSGMVMRTRVGKSHFRRRKAQRVKARLIGVQPVSSSATAKRIRRLAPYLHKYRQNPPA
ncbi:MAG: 50S ribosomal protein L35 [Chloroflexi bacterium]|nr:50S ribosomal protein L35 [Chloroflexota bacterium]